MLLSLDGKDVSSREHDGYHCGQGRYSAVKHDITGASSRGHLDNSEDGAGLLWSGFRHSVQLYQWCNGTVLCTPPEWHVSLSDIRIYLKSIFIYLCVHMYDTYMWRPGGNRHSPHSTV